MPSILLLLLLLGVAVWLTPAAPPASTATAPSITVDQTGSPWWSEAHVMAGVPDLVLVALVIAVIALLVLYFRGGKKFLLDFAVIMLGVFVLEFGVYQTHWFPAMFDGGWGLWGQLIFYTLAGLTIAASQSRTGKVQKIVFNLAIAGCIAVGVGETWHGLFGCDDACQLHKQQAAEAAVVQQAIHEDPYCNRRKVDYQFGTTEPAVPFNPAGQCAPELWHDGHCLWIRQAGNSTPIKHCGGAMPPDVESAWSADTAFEGAYKLLPPRYTTLARFKH